MDFAGLLNILKVEYIVALATAVSGLTKLVTLIPSDYLKEKAMIIAWVVSALVIWGVGSIEGVSFATMLTATGLVALVSHGVYDVAKKVIAWVRK